MTTDNASANTATSQHALIVNQVSENLYCTLVYEMGNSFSPDVSEEDFNSAFVQAALTFAANALVFGVGCCDIEEELCFLRKKVESIIAEKWSIAAKATD